MSLRMAWWDRIQRSRYLLSKEVIKFRYRAELAQQRTLYIKLSRVSFRLLHAKCSSPETECESRSCSAMERKPVLLTWTALAAESLRYWKAVVK